MSPDVVVTEFMDADALAVFGERPVVYDPGLVDQPERLAGLLGGARALIVRNRTRVDAALLDRAAGLRVVGRLGVGLDNIDVDACRARGVAVRPATGANDLAVVEYVLAAMLILVRGAFLSSGRVAAGEWPRNDLIGGEAAGRRLGLVGFGAIARALAAKAQALGLSVAAYDPFVAEDDPAWTGVARLDLGTLLETSDVLSLHTPLTPATRRLIGPREIARLKPGAVVINAARGGVLDEEAVVEALRSGRLGGAALDVFETEPLGPEAARRFADAPNLILTPHVAGVTAESNTRVSWTVARAVEAVLSSA